MKDLIIELITVYGFETVLIALVINILTGIIKIPIKKLASKLDDSSKVTRFIVFLPILIGFGITCLYVYFFKNVIVINRAFLTLFCTSTSLSLTFYAIFEKLFPNSNSLKNDNLQTKKILEEIESFFNSYFNKETIKNVRQ